MRTMGSGILHALLYGDIGVLDSPCSALWGQWGPGLSMLCVIRIFGPWRIGHWVLDFTNSPLMWRALVSFLLLLFRTEHRYLDSPCPACYLHYWHLGPWILSATLYWDFGAGSWCSMPCFIWTMGSWFSMLLLKGTVSQDFLLPVFLWISFPPASEYSVWTVSDFFENSRRYSQVKVHHRYQRQRWQIFPRCQQKRSRKSRGTVSILFFLRTIGFLVSWIHNAIAGALDSPCSPLLGFRSLVFFLSCLVGHFCKQINSPQARLKMYFPW